jgi:hypothetical protein
LAGLFVFWRSEARAPRRDAIADERVDLWHSPLMSSRFFYARRVVGLAVLAVFSLLAIASPGPVDPPEKIEPPPWSDTSDFDVELGRGWEDFRAYVDGEPIPLAPGFQGGQHVHITFLGEALTLDDSVSRVLTWYVDSSEAVLDGAYETNGSLEELAREGQPTRVGSPFGTALLWESALIQTEVELRVHIELADGRVGRASTSGLLEWEDELPDWSEWLCRNQGGGDLDCTDAGVPDFDAGVDSGVDAGVDAGVDSGVDAGVGDAGSADAGGDAGSSDAGASDAGTSDVCTSDSGTSDAGSADAGDGG